MKLRPCLLVTCFLLILSPRLTVAQTGAITSPQILPDHRVTFAVHAPKASTVSMFGDWMPVGSAKEMAKNAAGDWSVTVGPLPAGIYIYTFSVDGLTIADPINPRIKLRARTSASLLEIPGNPPEKWEARDVPHGTIEIISHSSTVLGHEMRQVWIYKPPGYSQSRSRKYPVLYLLHGSNDTPAGWTQVGGANYILDNLIAEKKAEPMIVVMPFGHAVPFGAPRELQSQNTTLMEKYLLDEVTPMVEKTYRVEQDRKKRALVGYSMGGGQSLQIGLGHLDRFAWVGGFSAGVPNDFEKRFQPLLEDPKAMNQKLNLLWIGCGKEDSLFPRSQQLSDLLTTRHINHVFRPTPGAHTYTVWRQYLIEIVPLLFQPTSRPALKG